MIQAAGHMVQNRDIIILKHINVRLTNPPNKKPSPLKSAILKSLPVHPFIGLKIQTQDQKILPFALKKITLPSLDYLSLHFSTDNLFCISAMIGVLDFLCNRPKWMLYCLIWKSSSSVKKNFSLRSRTILPAKMLMFRMY